MPENWKTYKLKELTTKIGSGATPRGGKGAYKESGISLIRSQNVLDFSFSSDGLAFIDDDQAAALKNVSLESQDVLLNITGDSVARVCKVPDHWLPARVNQHVTIVRANEKILNPGFLLYSLLSKENKNLLLTMAGAGATRNALTKTMIEEFEISVPGIQEQKSIASILSALDDKIELNLKMNKTLEEMAMALYKHWFVDFGPFQEREFEDSELGEIPKGWEVKPIGDVIETLGGGTPKTKTQEYWENGKIDWYSPTDLTKANSLFSFGTAKKITQKGLEKSSAKMFPARSLLMSSRATIGAITINRKPACTNQGFITMIPNETLTLFQLHGWTVNNMNLILSKANGSTFKEISKANFRALPILIGSGISEYIKEVENYYAQIENNLLENQTLTQLRDTLLPKLISGEVRVKDVEKTLTEVL